MKPLFCHSRSTVASLLLALIVAGTPPLSLAAGVISDFNQAAPDWVAGVPVSGDYEFELGNGSLTITVDSAGGDYDFILWDVEDLTLSDGAILELRLDLVSSSLTEFSGGPFFGFQRMTGPPSSIAEGYFFLKLSHIWQLGKYRNYALDGQRLDEVATLLWDFGGGSTKNENVGRLGIGRNRYHPRHRQ